MTGASASFDAKAQSEATALSTLSAFPLASVIIFGAAAYAGSSCDASPQLPKMQTRQNSLNLAERTLAAFDVSGQSVEVLARAGQDLGKYRLQYSHLGFAYKQPQQAADGQFGHVWPCLAGCKQAELLRHSQCLRLPSGLARVFSG